MSVQQRRKYDSDFKRSAVLLSEEPGRTVAEVAESLGVGKNLIYRWRRHMRERGEIAFHGNGKIALTSEQKKIQELEKKLKDTEMERDILKKAGSSTNDVELSNLAGTSNHPNNKRKRSCNQMIY